MINKNTITVETSSKSNRNRRIRFNIDTSHANTQLQDHRSHYLFCTGTSIKSGGVKIVLWAKAEISNIEILCCTNSTVYIYDITNGLLLFPNCSSITFYNVHIPFKKWTQNLWG